MNSFPCSHHVPPEPFEDAFRSNELWARYRGDFDAADYYRQAARSVESGFRHRAPRTFSGLRLASMAGWRLDSPEPCKGMPAEMVRCSGELKES